MKGDPDIIETVGQVARWCICLFEEPARLGVVLDCLVMASQAVTGIADIEQAVGLVPFTTGAAVYLQGCRVALDGLGSMSCILQCDTDIEQAVCSRLFSVVDPLIESESSCEVIQRVLLAS